MWSKPHIFLLFFLSLVGESILPSPAGIHMVILHFSKTCWFFIRFFTYILFFPFLVCYYCLGFNTQPCSSFSNLSSKIMAKCFCQKDWIQYNIPGKQKKTTTRPLRWLLMAGRWGLDFSNIPLNYAQIDFSSLISLGHEFANQSKMICPLIPQFV